MAETPPRPSPQAPEAKPVKGVFSVNAARFLGRKAQPWSLSQRIYVYAEERGDGRITL